MDVWSSSSPLCAWWTRARASSANACAVLAIAAAASWHPAPARANNATPDSSSTAVWFGGTVDLSWPSGSFDPAGDTPGSGLGAHLSIQPAHSRFGVRIEFGTSSSSASTDSVLVEFIPGLSTYETVSVGNNLWWFLVGAQWDPRPRSSSVYAFASLGVENISPKGVAGNDPIVHPVVPGLPTSSTVFAYSVGAGSRLVLTKRLGLCAEAEYLKGGAADYVAGVEGSNPTHYATRNGAIGSFVVRLGIVRLH